MKLYPVYQDFFTSFFQKDLDASSLLEKPKTLVVTPNRRLSRFVRQQWSAWMRTQSKSVGPQIPCLPIDTWQTELWQILQYKNNKTELLLSSAQTAMLWGEIIDLDKDGFEMVDSATLAKKAIAARNVLSQWMVDPLKVNHQSEAFEIFKRWYEAFSAKCAELRAIDDDGVREQLSLAKLDCEWERVVFLEFAHLSPLNDKFLESLAAQGIVVEREILRLPDSIVNKSACATEEQELYAAATWAAQSLIKDDSKQVAIVVPDITQNKASVERIFSEVFDQKYLSLYEARRPYAFTVSAAEPLNQTPLIGLALRILTLNLGVATVQDLVDVFCSPFVAKKEERRARYSLFKPLLESRKSCRMNQLQSHALKCECLSLSDSVAGFIEILDLSRKKRMAPSEWLIIFNAQLSAAGWLQGRELDSIEYQQWQQWLQVGELFCQLDRINSSVTLSEALEQLKNLAQHPFHPQTSDSPVQVLGLLEAAGLKFDRVWVCGIQENTWPPSPEPNPLLPVDMQRELGMPRSSFARELVLARELTDQFASAASEVVFSFHLNEGDVECSASNLILHYATMDASIQDGPNAATTEHIVLQSVDDHALPRLSEQKIKGGANLLKNQSDCPFRAAARHRLHAYGVQVFQEGMTPPIRGELIHTCLDLLWGQLKSQSFLLQMDKQDLDEVIHVAVNDAWQRIERRWRLNAFVKKIEIARTTKLINEWMEVEKQRAAFVVLNNEYVLDATIGPLTLSLRVDRVDQVNDEHILIIDYKTGRSMVKHWLSDRPKEPQLPAYLQAFPGQVDGIAFSELRLADVQFKGIGSDAMRELGLKYKERLGEAELLANDWQKLTEHWYSVLTKLAVDFFEGDARVDPNLANRACDFCDLDDLCRVDHQESVL